MVALPATGVEWEVKYGWNPLGIRKGIITNILMRDYHGSLTNLADPLVGLNSDGVFTPYALDGLYRDDLLVPTFPGGQFYDLGALKDDGVKVSANTDVQETMIAQSRRPQRYDLTKEEDEFEFTCREDNPVVDRLRFDMPLFQVPDIGATGYALRKPAEGDLMERQAILLAEDGNNRFAYIFPRVARKKIGDTQINKKDPHELNVSYGAILCPFAQYPVAIAREGSGERALAGAPIFGGSAPVATQTGATTATVAFTQPTLINDPAPDTFTYTLEKSISPFSSWTSATIAAPSVVGTTVTLSVTGLTTATAYKFRVTATATNTQSTVSTVSNTITTA